MNQTVIINQKVSCKCRLIYYTRKAAVRIVCKAKTYEISVIISFTFCVWCLNCRSIEELQKQNEKLIASIRELSEKHERQEKETVETKWEFTCNMIGRNKEVVYLTHNKLYAK